ncbi:MAG: tetratricopeptide repeat protein [Verrucomicrobiae bacterium]|nr:tetratricopeptide repeat protein [Verrucomicrobiae bacterium]NNJ43098.1 tetratricopeptide repeat protein [Akkermansiaceae bacterium]
MAHSSHPNQPIGGLGSALELLVKHVEQNPDDWETRKQVVQVLYNSECYRDASKMVWSAPEIPPVGDEVVFAARVVSKGQPARAVRLFDKVVEKNIKHPDQNLALAKLLVKAGMPYQAIRFYGAATALDPTLVDEDFEFSLVEADNDLGNWSEIVRGEAFPWDGPEPMPSVQLEDSGADIDMLSGATQPVPMKAPVGDERTAHLLNRQKAETESFSSTGYDMGSQSESSPPEVIEWGPTSEDDVFGDPADEDTSELNESGLSVPKELDGRTQLVSLTPQDSSSFFSELQQKYNHQEGAELPKPVVIARDMVDVDYIDLINKACQKDLDAFSKLLGLHRVMNRADCREWVDDMNLLCKGFGDAVLATVVSKYSVKECRDILSSLYSS